MMKAQELIKLNNEKRINLNDENLKYYEDVLLYIRTSLGKKEIETEEILAELLEHLLDAQKNGKTAEEIFGASPTEYAKEITDELPKIDLKENILFFMQVASIFLGSMLLFGGVLNLFSYYILDIGKLNRTIYLGSTILESSIILVLVPLFIYFIIKSLRWTLFKKLNKLAGFFAMWIIGTLSIGLFVLILYLISNFGYVIIIPIYIQILLGVIFAISGFTLYKINN